MVMDMKKFKLNLTSINDQEKSIFQGEANVVQDGDKYICTYLDSRDKDNVVSVKLVLDVNEAYIYQTRRSGVNTMYFKKNHTYQGKYYFHDSYFDLKIETQEFYRDGLVTFIKYKSYLNGEYNGTFEHRFEFKEKGECCEC